MLWELKNNKNATKTAKKISSIYDQGVITDCYVRNWFSKFCSADTSLRDEPRNARSSDLVQDTLRELWNTIHVKVQENWHLITTHALTNPHALNDKNFPQEDQIKTFVENSLNRKPAKFYFWGINKQPDKWQEVIQNNNEYTFDWNWFMVKLYMNKSYFTKMIQPHTYERKSCFGNNIHSFTIIIAVSPSH